MSLEVIYVVRHGFRSNWLVDRDGNYTAHIMSPTGNPADPALTAHGVDQAKELAIHLARVSPPVDRIYCSPYYRCLQTVQPFVEGYAGGKHGKLPDSDRATPTSVRCERGLVDWFGPAPFEHPEALAVSELQRDFFPWIEKDHADYTPAIPPRRGESMAQLHARTAAAMAHIVRECDAQGVKAVLVCSHAATIIAIGRALTGNVPTDVETEDFGTFTCGLSMFRRRRQGQTAAQNAQNAQDAQDAQNAQNAQDAQSPPLVWDDQFQTLSKQSWTGGLGVGGGWDCKVNCDCSFLKGGEERGWRFSGDDESFHGVERQSKPIEDAGLELGVVIKGRTTDQAQNLREGMVDGAGSGKSGDATTTKNGSRL